MRAYSADALVLRTYRYGEADRIVVFLTEDRGKKRGVAKNATASRRRFGAALEPLTRGRATYVEREHRELVRLDRVEPRQTPLGRGGRPRRLATARTRSGTRRTSPSCSTSGRPTARRTSGCSGWARRWARRSAGRDRSRRWRGTSSTGCCGSRACIRRSTGARAAGGRRLADGARAGRRPSARTSARTCAHGGPATVGRRRWRFCGGRRADAGRRRPRPARRRRRCGNSSTCTSG